MNNQATRFAYRYLGYVGIVKNGAPLPVNLQHANDILNIYFHEAELVALLDTLRNEKPIFVRFPTTLKWGSIGTNMEPVGEGRPGAGSRRRQTANPDRAELRIP